MVGSRDKQLHALDPKTGKPLWSFATKGRIDGSPVVVGDRVFVGSADGRLYELSVKTGEKLWQFEAGGDDRRLARRGRRPAGDRQRRRRTVLLRGEENSRNRPLHPPTSPSPCSTRSPCANFPDRRRVLHVEADGVQLVAGRFGQAIPGGRARVAPTGDAQRRFGDHPRVARPPCNADRRLVRIAFMDHFRGGRLVFGPSNDNMRGSLDFE